MQWAFKLLIFNVLKLILILLAVLWKTRMANCCALVDNLIQFIKSFFLFFFYHRAPDSLCSPTSLDQNENITPDQTDQKQWKDLLLQIDHQGKKPVMDQMFKSVKTLEKFSSGEMFQLGGT